MKWSISNKGILVSQDEKLVLVNRKAVECYGYSEEELLAIPIPDLVHPEDRELVLRHHQLRMDGFGDPAEYTFRILTRAAT